MASRRCDANRSLWHPEFGSRDKVAVQGLKDTQLFRLSLSSIRPSTRLLARLLPQAPLLLYLRGIEDEHVESVLI